MIKDFKVILASKSPRRKELLGAITKDFTIIPAEGEEIQHGTTPEEIVENLAVAKATEVYTRVTENSEDNVLVIGADTIVVSDGKILGKPRDREDAYNMLRGLSGKTHHVMTGVSLMTRERKISFCEITEVTFCCLSDAEIWEYIDSGDPFDKAGSYGIQSNFAKYVKGIKGDYNNVVGLPVARIYQELKG